MRFTRRLLPLAERLESVNRTVGVLVSWLALAMVLVTFAVVVLRYAFDAGSIALQESITYMHAILFMLGAAYTLQQDGHVRVDIFYQRFSRRGRAWVDLLGTLLLLVPICLFLLASSWDYVLSSWLHCPDTTCSSLCAFSGVPLLGAAISAVSSCDCGGCDWILEGSREAGGLPFVYLLKTLQIVMPLLLLLQGLIWMLRNSLFLAGVEAALPEPGNRLGTDADG